MTEIGPSQRRRIIHNAYMREWRKTHKPTEEQRRRGAVRAYANVYKRRGILLPQPCACGSTVNVEMHHHDYDHPLVVEWICRACHVAHHYPDANVEMNS